MDNHDNLQNLRNLNERVSIYNNENMELALTCPICLEIYKHPRNLNCGHTFCSTCIHSIIINNSITCPICRKIADFKDKSILDLTVNSSLISVVDNFPITPSRQLRRSKSYDSFTIQTKNLSKYKKIYYDENSTNDEDNGRLCCTFQ